jgi:geranylgeranyl diphosphate synthase type I
VTESARLVDLVQSRLDRLIDDRSSILSGIAEEVAPFGSFSRQFLRGGKRFRALFAYWGWQAVQGASFDPLPSLGTAVDDADLAGIVSLASAIEMFHAAALVHDDVIDSSDTRRGSPSAHRRFQRLHSENRWAGDPATFGTAAAILLGDLLLTWSDDLMTEGLLLTDDRLAAVSARAEWERMRLDVTAGQYLDLVEERAWPTVEDEDALPRAQRVILYKSAKYSVEAPLVLGAALGGGDERQVDALRQFGVPLGIAFQLRDDLLGVFGDSKVTGKPSGDDLREGKRTVLITLARTSLPLTSRHLLDELLGDRDLEDLQIELLQETVRRSGAVERVERMIEDNVLRASLALERAALSATAKSELESLMHAATQRAS